MIDIRPSDQVPPSAYTRPAPEEQLLAALQEIGGDGDGLDLQSLGLDFGGQPGSDRTTPTRRSALGGYMRLRCLC
jgi:hypothetical protein